MHISLSPPRFCGANAFIRITVITCTLFWFHVKFTTEVTERNYYCVFWRVEIFSIYFEVGKEAKNLSLLYVFFLFFFALSANSFSGLKSSPKVSYNLVYRFVKFNPQITMFIVFMSSDGVNRTEMDVCRLGSRLWDSCLPLGLCSLLDKIFC